MQTDVTGGNAPYLYELADETGTNTIVPAQNNSLFENLSAGNYTVKVQDSNGLEALGSIITIVEPLEISLQTIVTEISCNGSIDGSIEVFVTGGTAPYQYFLNDEPVSSNLFKNLGSGTYEVKVTDKSGCEINAAVEISEPEILTSTVTIQSATCIGDDGNLNIVTSGGMPPYQYSLGGTNYVSNNIFNNLSVGNYSIYTRDSNGCELINQVTVELIFESDFDNDGIADACDEDIDGDGVLNANDLCIDTPLGSNVNTDGCEIFTLPVTNFSVQTIGASCVESNNGSITISAAEKLSYTATLLLNNDEITSQSFTDTLVFNDLEAGIYQVCITVANQVEYENCYSLNITEPETFFVNSSIDSSGKAVTLRFEGGTNYTINLNGKVYETTNKQITLPLSKSNSLTVKTDKDCQGLYEENILFNQNVSIHPNPVYSGELNVSLDNTNGQDTVLELYTTNGSQLLRQSYSKREMNLKLNVSNIPSGVYLLKISRGTIINTHKIIIK